MELKAESLNIIKDQYIINKFCEHDITTCKQVKTYYDILCCFFEYLYYYHSQYIFQIFDNLSRKNPQVAPYIQTIYTCMTNCDRECILSGIVYQDKDYLSAIRSIADNFLTIASVDTFIKEFRFERHIKLIMFLTATIEVLCIDEKKTGSPFASHKKIGYGVISVLFLSLKDSLYMLLPNVFSIDLLSKIKNSINISENLQRVVFHCGHSILLQSKDPTKYNDSAMCKCTICNENLYTMDIGLAKKNHWKNHPKNICGRCSTKNNQFLCIDCEWPLCRDCLVSRGTQCICGLCKFMSTKPRFLKNDVAGRFLNMRKQSLQGQISNHPFANTNQYYASNPKMETLRLEVGRTPHPLNNINLPKENLAHMNLPAQKTDENQNFIRNLSASREGNQLAKPETSNDSCKKCKDLRNCHYCNGLFDKSVLNSQNLCKKCIESLRFKCAGCNSQKLCNAIVCRNCRIISLGNKPINMTKFIDKKNYIIIERNCKKCQTPNTIPNCYCNNCKNNPDDDFLIKAQEAIPIEKSQCYFSNCPNLEITACPACRKNNVKLCESHMQLHMQEHNLREIEREKALKPSIEGNSSQFTSEELKCSISGCKIVNCSKCNICQAPFCLHDMQTHVREYHKNSNIPEIIILPSSKTEPLGDLIKLTRKNVINSYNETIKQMQNYSNETLKLLDEIENADSLLKISIEKNNYSEDTYKEYLKYLEIPELEVNKCDSKAIIERNLTTFLKDVEVMRKKFDKENIVLEHFRAENLKIKADSDSVIATDNEASPQKANVEGHNS